jgi:hypothetical protein
MLHLFINQAWGFPFPLILQRLHSSVRWLVLSDAVSVLKDMASELRGEYSEVEKLVRLLLVLPASSAEAERSFNALRRLKTCLRSSAMTHATSSKLSGSLSCPSGSSRFG